MAVQREQVVEIAEKHVARGKIESAIREYRKLLADNPNDIQTLNRIGDLYARIQRIDEGVDFFTEVAKQYEAEGFFVKAIAVYKKIIRLDPTRLEVYEKLAELYCRQGLVNEGRTQYQVLADYYQKHDNAASAIAIYHKLADLEPHNTSYQVKLNLLQEQLTLTSDRVDTSDSARPIQLIPNARPETSSTQPTHSSPQTVPQKEPRGKSRSSRDYAEEIEKLSQTFLRRKATVPPLNPSSKSTKEDTGTTQASPAGPLGAKGGVFICYRRSDSMDVAGRMHDRLVAYYGRANVFQDVDSIPLGVDFRKHLEHALTQASIVVVVIGKFWLLGDQVAGAESGNPLSSPRDFVRVEIELALRLNLQIIPVLVRGAQMPSERDLPESLADLAYRNGMELRSDPNFHRDMDRLIAGIDTILKTIPSLKQG